MGKILIATTDASLYEFACVNMHRFRLALGALGGRTVGFEDYEGDELDQA